LEAWTVAYADAGRTFVRRELHRLIARVTQVRDDVATKDVIRALGGIRSSLAGVVEWSATRVGEMDKEVDIVDINIRAQDVSVALDSHMTLEEPLAPDRRAQSRPTFTPSASRLGVHV